MEKTENTEIQQLANNTPKRIGKVLEYRTYRGNEVIIYEYSYRKNKLVKNHRFAEHKTLISSMPSSLLIYKREYDLKDGVKPRMSKTYVGKIK